MSMFNVMLGVVFGVNVNSRKTPGAGLGYEIIDRGRMEWTVGGGGGYQYSEFDAVALRRLFNQPGSGSKELTADN
jgi:hypothetical protein